MTDEKSNGSQATMPWVRVSILLVGLAVILISAKKLTGQFFPTDSKDALIFQNSLLLIVLGSALLEHKFTKPVDSAINGLMGMITLVPVYAMPAIGIWWGIFLYCAFVSISAMICIAVSSDPNISGWRKRVAEITERPAVVLGKSRVLFSVVFLYAVISFYGAQSERTLVLVLFWALFVVIWPLRVPELITAFTQKHKKVTSIGQIVRTDAPNIIHVLAKPDTVWRPDSLKVVQQSDGRQRYLVPLFHQSQGELILATGLCGADIRSGEDLADLRPNHVYETVSAVTPAEALGADEDSHLIGFVDRDSSIGQLRIHTWNPSKCREGLLVWSNVGKNRVYYQLTDGITHEEGLESDYHGFQIAYAAQLGIVDSKKGFKKFAWLPELNSPVFSVPEKFGDNLIEFEEDKFSYGFVPGTSIRVSGNFADMLEYHTAILGVTGSGKTELAFDLLRHALKHETKVICIDLTARYEDRLADLSPTNLSISASLSKELGVVVTKVRPV